MAKFERNNCLPKTGHFYIFISLPQEKENGQNEHSFSFIYSRSTDLIRRDFPKDLSENHKLNPATIEYFDFSTLPFYDSYYWSLFENSSNDFYLDVLEPIEEFVTELYGVEDNLHQILGFDRSIQSSVLYDFARKKLNIVAAEDYRSRWQEIYEASKNYEVLLQLDCTDPEADLSSLGGSGVFYFGISKEDLAAKNFDNIIMSYQTT
jgi:uncharacterized protein YwqG